MAKVSPFHSTDSKDPPVYHDNDACTEGDNIKKKNWASGTDGRRKCSRYKELS